MSSDAQNVLDAALSLPDRERAELAEILWSTVEGPLPIESDPAWIAEIKRRVEAVKRGESKLHDWRTVIQDMRNAIR